MILPIMDGWSVLAVVVGVVFLGFFFGRSLKYRWILYNTNLRNFCGVRCRMLAMACFVLGKPILEQLESLVLCAFTFSNETFWVSYLCHQLLALPLHYECVVYVNPYL